jgi:dTDP-glucose 4,6-dehydratase
LTRRYLVTGGAGFIGSNFIRYLRSREADASVTNLDALTYAGVRKTVEGLDALGAHNFVHGDIRDKALIEDLVAGHDVIVHFAAETHVDRSIDSPTAFLETNVLGTGVLLDAARRHGISRFIHVSTDEVYGSISRGYATEDSVLAPSSPYSASKAASDLLVASYVQTFGYGSVITRCTNNYGPYQFPEKVIPLFITNLLDGVRLPLYGNGLNERDWLFVEDHCAALHILVDEGRPGEIYNIGANSQLPNIELALRIADAMGKGGSWIESVSDRPGHDFRYAVDSSKIRSLGWAPSHSFDERLLDTIEWYQKHTDWWRPLKQEHR